MFSQLLLVLALSAGLNAAVPFSQDLALDAALQTREADPNACPGYAASNVVKTGSALTADLSLAGDACNIYSDDIKDLKLVVEYETNERLHVKIYDAALQVYQVQEEVFPRPENKNASASDSALQFDVVEKPFSFIVKRKENGEVLFDTSSVPLIFEKQYVRLRTNLPQDPNIYGLGEHSDSFRFPNKYQRVLWNSESPDIPEKSNLYGSHPVYFDHRGGNGTHGVFMLNSSPMQIDMNQDSKSGTQYLEYNAVGGIIDLYFLAGKLPTDVSKQYAEVAGLSAMYPYWSLGFHQCKFGYWDVNMVAEVVANYSTAGIPLEVIWTDIDYMDLRQDFTTDPDRFPIPKMRELVSTLHDRGQRYVLILDPAIHAVSNMPSYQRGLEQDVFLKAADGSSLLGVQWPGAAVWPDWFHPNTQKWWTDEISRTFNKDTGIDLDGIWVDMNEGSNFCGDQNCNPREKEIKEKLPPRPRNAPRPNTGRPIPGFPDSFQPGSPKLTSAKARGLESRKVQVRDVESVESRSTKFDPIPKGLPDRDFFYPKFRINNHRGNLTDFTIYTNTTNHDGSWQYDTHNLYGHMMSHTTQSSMLSRRPGLRPFVLTRSTWAGTGRKATHWFGDNASTWKHYRTSIRQMLSFVSMHQMPLVGSDVCGFNQNAEEVLCARWAMLGAFQPFYRNHAEISTVHQEFYQWPLVTKAAKKAISTRYQLLDYIYTALHQQTVDGTPMINPLFFMYPNDSETFGIQDQWFYGANLLISPVVEENSKEVKYYLPEGTWYNFWTHEKLEESRGRWAHETNVTATDIPIHIRGGSIIPMRAHPANTTQTLRQKDFVVIVAPDKNGKAHGTLYLDEGEKIEQPNVSNIEFTFADGKLSTTGWFKYAGAEGESISVERVTILGQDQAGKKGFWDPIKAKVDVSGTWRLDGPWDLQI